MTSERTAYKSRWVLPVVSEAIENGVVVVHGSTIELVGRETDDAVLASLPGARVVDLGNCALMPGLVNTHTHLELTAFRGFLEGLAFRDWLVMLTAARRELLDEASLLLSAQAGIHEALRNGVTTCADTSDSAAPLQAMREAGIRGTCYVEVFGPDPRQCNDAIKGLRTRVERCRQLDTHLVSTGVSPHAPYTVSPELFKAVARYAIDDGLPVAVHIAESADEVRFVFDGSGVFADALRARNIGVTARNLSPIGLLQECEILETRPLLIHAVHVTADDVNLVAAAGASIAHCPISNAKLGHGIAPLQLMLDAGIAVGIGTDSVASNDRLDMLGEARQASLMAALSSSTPDGLSAASALRLATLGGAEALGLADRIGSLEAGKEADMAAFSLEIEDAGAVFDPSVALVHVLAGKTSARMVTVGGRELVVNGVLNGADDSVSDEMLQIGARLLEWRKRQPGGWRIG